MPVKFGAISVAPPNRTLFFRYRSKLLPLLSDYKYTAGFWFLQTFLKINIISKTVLRKVQSTRQPYLLGLVYNGTSPQTNL